MLIIRSQQMAAIEQAALNNFEDRVAHHLKRSFPIRASELGDEGVRNVTQFGIDRAKSHGFTATGNIQTYIDLMFVLGSYFDADLQMPWAAEIVDAETIPDETVRMDTLYTKAIDYLENAMGNEYEHYFEAMHRIRQESIDNVPHFVTGKFESYTAKRLRAIFPKKCQYIGSGGLRNLIGHGIERSHKYNISSERGAVVCIGMMFMLGSSVDIDPQFPWLSEILNDDTISGEKQKVDQLYKTGMDYLEKGLKLDTRGLNR